MESHKEWFEGNGDTRKAFCTVKRKGDPEVKSGEFSVADAKKAGLWGKTGPWTQYSDRMLKMRARGFALRDGFSDVLRGLGIAEEVQDYQAIKDVTPPKPPTPPEPPADDAKVEDNTLIDLKPENADQVSPEDMTPDDFVELIKGELGTAQSAEDLEEVWTARDPMAVLEGDDVRQGLAVALKNKNLKRLGVSL